MAGPGGGLTVAGVDKLTSEIAGKRTAEGEAEAEMKRQFLANARGQITGTNEGLHMRDPKGDELYLKFLATALPAYDAGRKAGKSAADLLNPDSKDYIGASVAQFKRTLAQRMSDMAGGNGAAQPEAAPDLSTAAAVVAAYKAGKVSRAEAEAAAAKLGYTPDRPAQPLVPVNE